MNDVTYFELLFLSPSLTHYKLTVDDVIIKTATKTQLTMLELPIKFFWQHSLIRIKLIIFWEICRRFELLSLADYL